MKDQEKEYAIIVDDVYKDFKQYYDKANTLKERLLFWKKRNTDADVLHILKGVSLKIEKGKMIGLIGTNGSGKSTLLKLMTKIIYPTKGSITTKGKIASLLELGAGFHPDFSGRENIYFNASIFGMTKEAIDQRIDDIIKFSELENFIDNPIRTYSSGMYMRLAFAVAINVDAEIILIDEILAVGDQHFQDKCHAKMRELKQQGKTLVLVSHTMSTVREFCDEVVWLQNGKIKMQGDVQEVTDAYLEACR